MRAKILTETSEKGIYAMEQYLLGIDVGTTGTKTLLFRADGVLIGHAYRPYQMYTPQVGWSEQNAEDWWDAVVQTVREVLHRCTGGESGERYFTFSSGRHYGSCGRKLYARPTGYGME